MAQENNRHQTTYNKVVNVAEDGEITVLNYVFQHENGFKGATGSTYYPVSKTERYEAIDEENMIENFIHSGLDIPKGFERGGWQSVVDSMDEEEREDQMFDTSDRDIWDYLREELGLTEEEAVIFTCTGGGRCFNASFQGNRNEELSTIIRQYESKA